MQPKKEMSKEGCGSGGFKTTLKKKKKDTTFTHIISKTVSTCR